MSVTLTAPEHEIVQAACSSCGRPVVLECEGLPGFWGYQTYNAYVCPYCGKGNHARTPGAIAEARTSG